VFEGSYKAILRHQALFPEMLLANNNGKWLHDLRVKVIYRDMAFAITNLGLILDNCYFVGYIISKAVIG